MKKRLNPRRFLRKTRGAAIVEFALVVPILFLLVWGIISFTRAYQRLNALTSSLREGARMASTMDSLVSLPDRRTLVRAHMRTFSTAFGFPIDTNLVNVTGVPIVGGSHEVRVGVVNYPIFSGLSFVGGLSSITVSREAIFRCEQSCGL